MEVKDLAGLSKPMTKLITVLSSGFGTIYKPIGIRREAVAQAEATLMNGDAQLMVDVKRARAMAEVEADNLLLIDAADSQILQRAQDRLHHRELTRQINLEGVAAAATLDMPDEVSDTPVDEDWKTRFFNVAQDVSNGEMQKLWGKILAGEVAIPGTFSIRTLEVLRNLSQPDAQIFQRLRYLACDSGTVLKLSEGEQSKLEDFGLNYDDILLMREAGLLADGDVVHMTVTIPDGTTYAEFTYNGKSLLLQPKNIAVKVVKLQILVLTRSGKEHMSLIDPVPNLEFMRKFALQKAATLNVYFGEPGQPIEALENLSMPPL